ncbi:MAG: tannase/feruloyl esterase family alpha/beta hydrolase [Alphaproteobacteria bacterium]|nr:tannase/feruloyl esterase family alpha/beta hydrolase [Alphaproteobacteria bacterium]
MTEKAKAVIKAYYGKAQDYAYWNGCSTGGRQGWIEAQLFPEGYDGILAGVQLGPFHPCRALAGACHEPRCRSACPATEAHGRDCGRHQGVR